MTDQNDDSREQGVSSSVRSQTSLKTRSTRWIWRPYWSGTATTNWGWGRHGDAPDGVRSQGERPPTSPPTTYTRASSGWSVTTRSAGRTTRTGAAARRPRRTARRSRCRQAGRPIRKRLAQSRHRRPPPMTGTRKRRFHGLALACRLIILIQHLSPLSHDQAPTQARVLRVQRHYHPNLRKLLRKVRGRSR